MTPHEIQQAKDYFQAGAKLLKANTAEADLECFESIELIMRKYMLELVGPTMGEIFFPGRTQRAYPENGGWVQKRKKDRDNISLSN